MIELFLFENESDKVAAAVGNGIGHFMVDWETVDKPDRQKGYDTEIRPGTVADLAAAAQVARAEVWCRVNRHGPWTATEVENAVTAGAAGLFLPMGSSVAEVERFLRLIDGRCAAGILIETVAGFRIARQLAALPFARAYFGLNDFAISRGGGSIFRALLDGSVERMAEVFADRPFGFGGLTSVAGGAPVPARLLLQEMARLNCKYSFLRRSFRRDTLMRDAGQVVGELRDAWAECRRRDRQAIERDHRALRECLNALCGG